MKRKNQINQELEQISSELSLVKNKLRGLNIFNPY